MPERRRGSEADFFFQAGPYSEDDMRVVRFEGREGLSDLFHFRLEIAMEDPSADFDAVLGKTARLRIEGREGARYVSGIVSEFEQSGEPTRLTLYTAQLVPKIWLLSLRQDCRIFQEMKVPDIIKKVLQDAKIPQDEFEFKLTKSYVEREYCVQYRESDLTFIARLMEEEGIYFWFQHTEDKHVLMMGDAASIHAPIEGDSELIFHEVTGEEPEFEHIYRYRYSQQVRPGEVVLRDFDFKKPTLDLTATKDSDRDKDLSIFDHPGEYVQPAVGKTLSEVRLEEFQTTRRIGSGKSNCRRLLPGYKFKLTGHQRQELNQDYLLTHVLHFGSQIQTFKEAAGASQTNEYRSDFNCVPFKYQYRPPRLTPRPVIHSSQTAIVTGPAGEEIYPDEHGRVKVQFHWDRKGKKDDKSSCWIRVSQTWAGPSWGAIIIPRIGQEVVVQFLEGDPDRPIITGTVYNGDNRPPFALPGGKSQAGFKSNSTLGGGGYNELVLDDTKGNELIRLHGQFDMDSTIEHDLREHVLNDRTRDVTNNEKVTVGVDQTYSIGNNQSGKVGVDKTLQVGSNHTESIGANKSLKVGANHTENIGSNMTITIGSNLTETVGINYAETVGAAMQLTIGGAMTQTIGAAYALAVGGAMAMQVGSNSSESVGGKKDQNVGSNASENVGGSKTVSVASDVSEKVGGKQSTNISSDLSETVGGKHTENVSAGYSLSAETVKVVAKNEITISTGSSKIEMKSDGTIKITGNNITIQGTQSVTVKGMKISSEASTSHDVKGAMVTVDASGVNTIKGSLVKIN